MKVLYLSNAVPSSVIQHAKLNWSEVGGGWIESMISLLAQTGRVQPAVAFPLSQQEVPLSGITEKGLAYFSFPKQEDLIDYNTSLVALFEHKIKAIAPDLVHIFGTEYPYALSMVQACEKCKIEVIVSIQGLLQQYVKAYLLTLPSQYTRKRLTCVNRMLYYQQRMNRRSVCEQQLLQTVKYVTGRTHWDHACTQQINPRLQYLFCNEVLREEFYCETVWQPETCVQHRIFLSQASYPIKGAHILLRNLQQLVERYPDLTVHIGGYPPMETKGPRDWKESVIRNAQNLLLKCGLVKNYPAYINALLREYGLEHRVCFCGPLTAKQMKQEYLQANVFVSCSTIENSPNSLGEAMILGVPIVASHVGGVADMLAHGKEGYLFPLSEDYMLPYYIETFFENNALCVELAGKARARAKRIFDKEVNCKQMLQHYCCIHANKKGVS